MKITKRTSRAVAVLVTCVMGVVAGVAAPAQAAVGDKPYWSSFPTLQQGRYPNSSLVRFWQRIVWSDINTGLECGKFADGAFGPNTDLKTRTWQSTFGVEVDGSVGPQTWSRAQSNLRLTSTTVYDNRSNGSGDVWTYLYYNYAGKRVPFWMAFAKREVWVLGIHQNTFYEPWEYHNCNGTPTAVSW